MLTPYSFSATSEFSPQKEIYKVDDTIYLFSSFPKVLLNSVSNQQVDYSNSVGIGGNIGIGLIDSVNSKFEVGTDNFDFETINGDLNIGSNKSVNISYEETPTSYVFKTKIITRVIGNYVVGVSNLASRGIKNKNCTNAGFSMFVTNSNKHFDILTNANIPGVSLDEARVASNYCFRVQ